MTGGLIKSVIAYIHTLWSEMGLCHRFTAGTSAFGRSFKRPRPPDSSGSEAEEADPRAEEEM